MADLRITLDLAGMPAVESAIYRGVYPLLTEAVRAVAQQAAANWVEAIHDAPLWVVERDAYAASVQTKMTGAYSALVWSDYRYAYEIENGRPARDLKRMLNTSMKVRRTQAGTRFLVIPFRHNADSMPDDVRGAARQLAPSAITGQGRRQVGQIVTSSIGGGMRALPPAAQKASPYLTDVKTKKAATTRRNIYHWGERLGAGAGRKYAGMVKFEDMAKPGSHTQYMTFRVMSEKSAGWIVPAKPGLNIARGVVDAMQPVASEIFAEAIKRST